VTSGSVTSVGVAYPRELPVEDLARHVESLLGPVLGPPRDGRWPVRFVGGAHDAWVEVEIREDAGHRRTREQLERYLGSEYGEIEVTVDLDGIGPVEGVLRPETAVCGLLLDLPDAVLFPERDRERPDIVAAAIRELLLRWYDTSRFARAFADHEAEFEIDPLDLSPQANPFALLAEPSDRSDGPPLDFHAGAWPLSPLGA